MIESPLDAAEVLESLAAEELLGEGREENATSVPASEFDLRTVRDAVRTLRNEGYVRQDTHAVVLSSADVDDAGQTSAWDRIRDAFTDTSRVNENTAVGKLYIDGVEVRPVSSFPRGVIAVADTAALSPTPAEVALPFVVSDPRGIEVISVEPEDDSE